MRKTTHGYYDPELGKFYHEKENIEAYEEFIDFYDALMGIKKRG